jgi:acyl carrier protein
MPHDNDMNDLALIRDFLKDRVDPTLLGKVVPDATLTDVGIDSLMQAELLFELEDKTGMTIPLNLPAPKTVGEMLQQLKDIRSQQATK